jgi:hypothetical protein
VTAVNGDAQAAGVGLAQLERAVKAGVRTRDDYAAKLVELGVSVDDQVTLLGILDAELADLAAAKAKRDAPPPAPAAPGLSRADVESAVRAGLASSIRTARSSATRGTPTRTSTPSQAYCSSSSRGRRPGAAPGAINSTRRTRPARSRDPIWSGP